MQNSYFGNMGINDFLMQLMQESAMYDQQNNYIHDSLCLNNILNSYCAHQPHGDVSRSPELQIKSSAFKTMKDIHKRHPKKDITVLYPHTVVPEQVELKRMCAQNKNMCLPVKMYIPNPDNSKNKNFKNRARSSSKYFYS